MMLIITPNRSLPGKRGKPPRPLPDAVPEALGIDAWKKLGREVDESFMPGQPTSPLLEKFMVNKARNEALFLGGYVGRGWLI